MSLRTSLALSVCVGCLLSGCSGSKEKKPETKRPKGTPSKEETVKKDGSTPPKTPTPTPVEKTPEPKRPRELSKATLEGWEKHGFTAGWRGTNPTGEVVFATESKDLRDVLPAFKARKTTDDAGLKGLPVPEVPFALVLTGTKVRASDLKELAAFPNLAALDLGDTDVTDAGLKEVASLKGLSSLRLVNTGVTDAGMKDLAGLQNLTSLDLGLTGVTDAGVKELAGLKNLASLKLTFTKVTDAGLKEIRQALPKCVVK